MVARTQMLLGIAKPTSEKIKILLFPHAQMVSRIFEHLPGHELNYS